MGAWCERGGCSESDAMEPEDAKSALKLSGCVDSGVWDGGGEACCWGGGGRRFFGGDGGGGCDRGGSGAGLKRPGPDRNGGFWRWISRLGLSGRSKGSKREENRCACAVLGVSSKMSNESDFVFFRPVVEAGRRGGGMLPFIERIALPSGRSITSQPPSGCADAPRLERRGTGWARAGLGLLDFNFVDLTALGILVVVVVKKSGFRRREEEGCGKLEEECSWVITCPDSGPYDLCSRIVAITSQKQHYCRPHRLRTHPIP